MPGLKDALKKPDNIGDMIPPVSPSAQNVPAVTQREQPGLAPGSLGPAPSIWTTSFDSVRQWIRPGTSQQRFPPLPVKANPQVNAAARSAAQSVVAATTAATPTDDDSIGLNLQTGRVYAIQSGDENKLISIGNAAGGFVYLPPVGISSPNPSFGLNTQATAASDNTLVGTSQSYGPFTPSDATQCVFTAIVTEGITTIAPSGSSVVLGGNHLFLSTLTVNPTTYTASYPAGAGASIAAASFDTITGTATISQSSVGSYTNAIGGTAGAVSTSALSTGVPSAHSIVLAVDMIWIVAESGHPAVGGPAGITSIADDQGNVYQLLDSATAALPINIGGFTNSTLAALYFCASPKNGPKTFTVNTFGSFITQVDITVADVNGLSLPNFSSLVSPFWCYVENTGVGTFSLISGAAIDGTSNPLSLPANQGVLLVWNGTGWYTERGISNAPVTSVFGRTGAVVAQTGDYTVAQVTGAAPLASPTFTGVPAAPTASPGDNTTQIATDAFVEAAINGIISGSTPADGLRHGDAVWMNDSAWVGMRDDFFAYGGSGSSVMVGSSYVGIGELGWCLGGHPKTTDAKFFAGTGPNLGQFSWTPSTTTDQAGVLILNEANQDLVFQPNSMALLENPGWKASWVFKIGSNQINTTTQVATAFTSKSLYVGLTGPVINCVMASSGGSRPDCFLGVRYDTSTVPPAYGIVSIAAASGGNTVYTIASSGFSSATLPVGMSVTVRGCLNAANNGTFTIVSNTASTITLNNAVGVLEALPSPGVLALAAQPLTAAAAVDAHGNTAYTATQINPTGLVASQYVGMSFVVSGFLTTFVTGTTSGTITAGHTVTQDVTGATAVVASPAPTGTNHLVFTGTPTGAPDNSHAWRDSSVPLSNFYTPTSLPASTNNGTFTCIANLTTSITLNNPNGFAETQAATASSTSLNDTTFKFELVENYSYGGSFRRQLQGTVVDTTVTPTLGTWYRLDMVCTVAGQVTLSLNGAHNHTFTASAITFGSNGSANYIANGTNGNYSPALLATYPSSAATPNGTFGIPFFGAGSSVTIAGLTGGSAGLNNSGTPWILEAETESGGGSSTIWFLTPGLTVANGAQTTGTLTGYPALTPVFLYGNDNSVATSGRTGLDSRFYVDYFSLVWNKGIIDPTNSPTATDDRYW